MTDERWKFLMSDDRTSLLDQELREGWHWCPDWDCLLIGPGMSEVEACRCGKIGAKETPAVSGEGG